MDIAKYIGETTEYDKKQEVERRKVKSWLKSVSAFANGGGGCLLFGIADNDTIIGLTDAKTDAEFISQKIKERIDPMPQIDLKIERVEDKELLILQVHGGEDTPYYYIGDSVLETFVRQFPNDVSLINIEIVFFSYLVERLYACRQLSVFIVSHNPFSFICMAQRYGK